MRATLGTRDIDLAVSQPPSTVPAAPVLIHVDGGRSREPVMPFWSFFGYDEPIYTSSSSFRDTVSLLELKWYSCRAIVGGQIGETSHFRSSGGTR